MGIVFSCLALLFVVFWAFGAYMKHKQRIARATEKHATLLYKTGKKTIEVTQDLSHKTNILLKDGLKTKGIDKEIYMAVISLALKEYLEDVHDVESGIIMLRNSIMLSEERRVKNSIAFLFVPYIKERINNERKNYYRIR